MNYVSVSIIVALLLTGCGGSGAASAPGAAPLLTSPPTTVPAPIGETPLAPEIIAADVAVAQAVRALQAGMPYMQMVGAPDAVRGRLDTTGSEPRWLIALHGSIQQTLPGAPGLPAPTPAMLQGWAMVQIDARTAMVLGRQMPAEDIDGLTPLTFPVNPPTIPTPPPVAVTTPVPTFPPVAEIGFPLQRPQPDPQAYPAARVTGTLIVIDSCLRLRPDDPALADGSTYLPVWPPDYTLEHGAGWLMIRNGRGNLLAQTGEHVAVGGGVISVTPATWSTVPLLGAPPPAQCGGPYWIVSGLERAS